MTEQERQRWTVPTPRGDLVIRQARPEDIPTLVAIEEDAARWSRSRGIEPGHAPRPLDELFARRIQQAGMHLALRDGQPAGKITIDSGDDPIWVGIAGNTLCVHGLTTARAFTGQQVGRAMLRWAEERARAAGKAFLRLDCNADNPALRAYYESAGFAPRGTMQLSDRLAARYEMTLKSGEGA